MLAQGTDAEEAFVVRPGVRGILLIGALVALVAVVRQRLRAERSSDNWVSSYSPGAGSES